MNNKKNIDLENEIINRIKDVIHNTSPGSEIFLYGSRARGTSNKYSDWDLLILLNTKKLTFAFEREMIDKLYEIEIETGELISPLIYTKIDWLGKHSITPLFENIQKQGIQIT